MISIQTLFSLDQTLHRALLEGQQAEVPSEEGRQAARLQRPPLCGAARVQLAGVRRLRKDLPHENRQTGIRVQR